MAEGVHRGNPTDQEQFMAAIVQTRIARPIVRSWISQSGEIRKIAALPAEKGSISALFSSDVDIYAVYIIIIRVCDGF